MNTLFRLPLPVRVVIIAVAWFSYAILVLDLNSLDSGSRSAEPIWTACLVGAALTVVVDLTAAAFVLHPTDWEGVELALSSQQAIEHMALPYDPASRRLYGVV